ncbi:MAG TPA: SRPBCC family protein [Candidatus Nitrosotalea sp.]|nr:SRPBCC family protein [Candidatus Nitrosotalea sp.]
MKRFKHFFVVDSDIDTVWKFYTSINHLKLITPKRMKLEILKTTHEFIEEGSEVWLRADLILNSYWHSKITFLKPYEYVDEMISGRFKVWKHSHKFERIDNDKTEIIDQIDFQLPYGLLGRLAESYVVYILSKVFEYREQETVKILKK